MYQLFVAVLLVAQTLGAPDLWNSCTHPSKGLFGFQADNSAYVALLKDNEEVQCWQAGGSYKLLVGFPEEREGLLTVDQGGLVDQPCEGTKYDLGKLYRSNEYVIDWEAPMASSTMSCDITSTVDGQMKRASAQFEKCSEALVDGEQDCDADYAQATTRFLESSCKEIDDMFLYAENEAGCPSERAVLDCVEQATLAIESISFGCDCNDDSAENQFIPTSFVCTEEYNVRRLAYEAYCGSVHRSLQAEAPAPMDAFANVTTNDTMIIPPTDCPDVGQFIATDTLMCQTCNSNCNVCAGGNSTQNACATCLPGFTLVEGGFCNSG